MIQLGRPTSCEGHEEGVVAAANVSEVFVHLSTVDTQCCGFRFDERSEGKQVLILFWRFALPLAEALARVVEELVVGTAVESVEWLQLVMLS